MLLCLDVMYIFFHDKDSGDIVERMAMKCAFIGVLCPCAGACVCCITQGQCCRDVLHAD